MATRSDSVHARSTDLHRAATCTCDKQTACVLGLCAARHLSLSLCVMRVQLAFDFDLQLAHEQEWFFRNYLPERLIPHLHVCEIPLRTLLIHCRDVHTFVKTQVSISGNFVSQTLVVRFRLDVFPKMPMNILPSEDSSSACGSDAALSFASNCSLSSKPSVWTSAARFRTVNFRCPWRVLCLHWT